MKEVPARTDISNCTAGGRYGVFRSDPPEQRPMTRDDSKISGMRGKGHALQRYLWGVTVGVAIRRTASWWSNCANAMRISDIMTISL